MSIFRFWNYLTILVFPSINKKLILLVMEFRMTEKSSVIHKRILH